MCRATAWLTEKVETQWALQQAFEIVVPVSLQRSTDLDGLHC